MALMKIGSDVALQDDVGTLRMIDGDDAIVMSASTGELIRIAVDDLRPATPRSAETDPVSHATSLWLLGRAPQQIVEELHGVYDEATVHEAMEKLSEFVFEATADRPYYVGDLVRIAVDGTRVFGKVVSYAPANTVWVEWDLPTGKTSVGRIATDKLDRSYTLLLRAKGHIARAARRLLEAQQQTQQPPNMGRGTPDDPSIVPKISPTRREPDIGLGLDEHPTIEQIPQAPPELAQIAQKLMQAQEALLQARQDKAAANALLAETDQYVLVKNERANEADKQDQVNRLALEYKTAVDKFRATDEVTDGPDFRRFEMALKAAEGSVRQIVAMVNPRVKTQEDEARGQVIREVLGRVRDKIGPLLAGLDEAMFYFQSAVDDLEGEMIGETTRQIHEVVVAEFPYTENMEKTTRPRSRPPKAAPQSPDPGIPTSGQAGTSLWSQIGSLVGRLAQGVQHFTRNLFSSQDAVRRVTPELESFAQELQQALSGSM